MKGALLIITFGCLTLGYATASIAGAEDVDNDHPRLMRPRGYVPISEELTTEFWMDKAQAILANRLQQTAQKNTKRAKNVILFLGDGMSVHTVAATRNYLGDSTEQISFEKFPYVGLSKTYSVDKRTPDSACTGTAYLNGVKANYGTIGVSAKVKRKNCKTGTDPSTHTESLAKWAQDAGKWSGLVTTARVTHASPAAVYAHTADRNWEYDGYIESDKCNATENVDIARQLVEWPVGKNLRVILGGGRQNFRDERARDEEGEPGLRTDGRDLIKDWLADKASSKAQANYVWSKKGLSKVDLEKSEYLLGLFSPSHCPYHGDLKRDHLENSDPSLSVMTEAAIKMLSKHEQGYFLFVEGAKIDMAHHSTKARKSLEETEQFAEAIQLARNITNEEDTLIVVTSDHSHTMTINGYPYRRQDILGLGPANAVDGLPYTILSYANGAGFSKTYKTGVGRVDWSKDDLKDAEHRYMATLPLSSETHGADDVGIFALGPWAHYFSGNIEQSSIPALMAYAADMGPFKRESIFEDL